MKFYEFYVASEFFVIIPLFIRDDVVHCLMFDSGYEWSTTSYSIKDFHKYWTDNLIKNNINKIVAKKLIKYLFEWLYLFK